MKVETARDLRVYEMAFRNAMSIFEMSKNFPPEERFALTSQIRRSSRSVCLNLCEAWAKRRYEAHFVSKLTDCDGENAETRAALDFARECAYIDDDSHLALSDSIDRVGRMLGTMIHTPSKFLLQR